MSRRVLPTTLFSLLLTGTAWAQCPEGTVEIIADRDNTLYEDATGMLSNGSGSYLFAGRTGQGSEPIRRGLIHFDVATAVDPEAVIAGATLQLTLDQPQDHGLHAIGLHDVQADWGEGASVAGMGQGGGGAAMANDATWLNTFFNTATWTTAGGDFDTTASASTVSGGTDGVFVWQSLDMVNDAQDWLDTPGTNYGWLVMGTEGGGTTSLRFGSRENSGNEPTLCLELCPDLTDCTVFSDGFESGTTTAWTSQVPALP